MNLDDLHTTKDAGWSVTQVASLLELDERTVRRACQDGQLPCLHVGRRLLIPTQRLRQLLCPSTPDMSADPTGEEAIRNVRRGASR